MPRRYKEDPRTFFKTFRFTAAELTRLENRARARRQDVSEYVRGVLFSREDDAVEAAPSHGQTSAIAERRKRPPPITPAPSPKRSISTYVRGLLFDPGSGAGKATRPAEPEEEYDVGRLRRASASERILIDQLRKVGTNLNQIAHRMNERRIPPPRELTLTLDEIRDLVRQARER